jgi:SAM-dependent methyltransferase
VPFEDFKAKMAHVWGAAPWERVADALAPVQEHIVRALEPRPGMRFLDVGTGTGAVAIRAARAGADVIGVDPAEPLLETARRVAAAEGLEVRFERGDAEDMPFSEASFDSVGSSMGFIFAPDHAAAAAELARVTRPGGRIALSAWIDQVLGPVTEEWSPPLPAGQGDSLDWGREEYVREHLGESFDLAFESGESGLAAPSGEEGWLLFSAAVGPLKALAGSLGEEDRERLHRKFVDYFESHRTDDGVRVPGRYLVVVGTRR